MMQSTKKSPDKFGDDVFSITYLSLVEHKIRNTDDDTNNSQGVFLRRKDKKIAKITLVTRNKKNSSFKTKDILTIQNNARFIASSNGDIDGDGVNEIVVGISYQDNTTSLKYLKYIDGEYKLLPIINTLDSKVNFIRTVSIGDINNDGHNEIIIGTRPHGYVICFSLINGKWEQKLIDQYAYGIGTTNTREVTIAKIQNETAVYATIARSNDTTQKGGNYLAQWHRTPGRINKYTRTNNIWTKTTIDDYSHQTHTRMILSGDVDNDGENELISISVGVIKKDSKIISTKPSIKVYKKNGDDYHATIIDQPEGIKARAAAIGDIDNDGKNELIIGTRSAFPMGQTYLYSYSYSSEQKIWEREVIDTSSEYGFHCVAISKNAHGTGIIASEDGFGSVNFYKRAKCSWTKQNIIKKNCRIFVENISKI